LQVVAFPLLAQVPPRAETVPLPSTRSVSATAVGDPGVPLPNVAVTDFAAVIVTVQFLFVPLHAPPHPLNPASPVAAAANVTLVPDARLTLQVVFPSPQSMLPPVTRPAPVTETVNGKVVGVPPPPVPVNAALTVLSLVIVKVQLVFEPEQAPPHTVNPAPEPGVAFSVTEAPESMVAVQPEPPADVQLIPLPVTVPFPLTVTASVCDDAPFTKAAFTVWSDSIWTVQLVAVPEHGPPHPAKSKPEFGDWRTVTVEPVVTSQVQPVSPGEQLIEPSPPLTVPPSLFASPVTLTVRVLVPEPACVKTATSSSLSVEARVNVQGLTVPLQSSEPSQPSNVQPGEGVAVSVMTALLLVSK
jgi:hypothetical protein